MEGREIIRRSLTLSDHMSTPATDGSSALKLRQEEATPSPPPPPPHPAVSPFSSHRSLTLGSVIASEKREAFAARGALGASSSRTLMDIIREEHPMGPAEREAVTANNPAEINWRSFKNRLQIRTDGAGDSAAAGLSTSPVLARSVSVQRNEMPVPSPAAAPPPPAEEEEQPVRMSLMALLEQTDGRGEEEEGEEEEEVEEEGEEERGGGGGGGMHYACCVCMVRHKGAAFIPCGHTFCRLCSRELWVSRGNCPLCNGYILEILDIF